MCACTFTVSQENTVPVSCNQDGLSGIKGMGVHGEICGISLALTERLYQLSTLMNR